MALDVRLVQMPFAQLNTPSLALTQLKSVAASKFPIVEIEIEYLNHVFGKHIGPYDYQNISNDNAYLHSGFGDWLFRGIAFPSAPDNTKSYLARYGRAIGDSMIADLSAGHRFSKQALETILDDVIRQRGLAEASVVGFSSSFAQTVPCLALARKLRDLNPTQILIIGGANCEGAMGLTLANNIEYFDYVVSGPGLIAFPSFLKCLIEGKHEQIRHVPGFLPCKVRNGSELSGQDNSIYGQELDIREKVNIEYEDFLESFFNLARTTKECSIDPCLFFETSRGCWWGQKAHCTFCGLNGATMAYRAMPAALAREQITELVERYGSQVRLFDCVDNIMPKTYIKEVFSELNLPHSVSIFYETKADLSDEDVSILSHCGVDRIQPGIESLATSTLKLMRKGTTAFQNIRLLRSCIKHNVEPMWNLLVGFPGEDPGVFDLYVQLLPKLFHLYPPSGVFPVRFDRFSPYHENPASFGIQLIPADYYHYCYPFNEDVLERIAYYFYNTNPDSSYYLPLASGFGPVEKIVQSWRARWDASCKAKPRLELRADTDGGEIIDSRGDAEIAYRINVAERELIEQLSQPAELGPVARESEQALTVLRQRDLVFEERARVVSLLVQ